MFQTHIAYFIVSVIGKWRAAAAMYYLPTDSVSTFKAQNKNNAQGVSNWYH